MRANLLSHPSKWEKFHAFFEVLTDMQSIYNLSIILYVLGEKIGSFYKIKKGDPSDLRPQENSLRLNDKLRERVALNVILSVSEESPTFMNF